MCQGMVSAILFHMCTTVGVSQTRNVGSIPKPTPVADRQQNGKQKAYQMKLACKCARGLPGRLPCTQRKLFTSHIMFA